MTEDENNAGQIPPGMTRNFFLGIDSPPSSPKKISFYADPDVQAWYETLPRYKGTEIINQILRDHFTQHQKNQVDIWSDAMPAKYLAPGVADILLANLANSGSKSALEQQLENSFQGSFIKSNEQKVDDRLEHIEKRLDAVIMLVQQLATYKKQGSP